jgi:hypothetical protein
MSWQLNRVAVMSKIQALIGFAATQKIDSPTLAYASMDVAALTLSDPRNAMSYEQQDEMKAMLLAYFERRLGEYRTMFTERTL